MLVGIFLVLMLAVLLSSAVAALRWRQAPFVGAVALVLTYLALLLGSGIWTLQCPNCPTGDGDRSYYWTTWAIVNAVLLAWGVLICLVGGAVSVWMRHEGRH